MRSGMYIYVYMIHVTTYVYESEETNRNNTISHCQFSAPVRGAADLKEREREVFKENDTP